MKKKLIATFMAALFSAAIFVACAETKEIEETTKGDVAETTESEVTSEETSEQIENTESTEMELKPTETEITEAEPTIDLSFYQEGSFYDIKNNESYGKRLHSFKDKITDIASEHPDEILYFSYGVAPYLYYTSDFNVSDGWPCFAWFYDTDEFMLMDEQYGSPGPAFTYEDFMKLPRFVYSGYGNCPTKFENSVFDGEYYGTITAVSTDATKVLMYVEEPVLISADEFNNLTPGYHISAADGDPNYSFPNLNISDNYDPADPTTMFDDYCLMFAERESGDYILVDYDGDFMGGSGMNARYVFLDVDPECNIDDYDTPTAADSFTPFGYVDGPTTFARSMIFWDISKESNAYAYDDWMAAFINVQPCFIENNTIKSMRVKELSFSVYDEFRNVQ